MNELVSGGEEGGRMRGIVDELTNFGGKLESAIDGRAAVAICSMTWTVTEAAIDEETAADAAFGSVACCDVC